MKSKQNTAKATKAPAKKTPAKKVALKKAPAKKVTTKKGPTDEQIMGRGERTSSALRNLDHIQVTKTGRFPSDRPNKSNPPKSVPVAEPVKPPVAPVIVLPKSAPPPEKIELVHEGKVGQGKRYVSKTEPDSKYHLRDRSDAPKPVSIVRTICEANIGMERKAVIQLCMNAGVNKNTAATQYSLWKAAKAKATATPEPDEQ